MLRISFSLSSLNFSWIVVSAFLLLSACAKPPESYKIVGNVNSLSSLEQMHAVALTNKRNIPGMRAESLQDIAMSVGAQAGLAWCSERINQVLEQNSANLDRAFNFNLMLLSHNVVPPVLVQSENLLSLSDPTTIRLADRTYQIVSQAHFVTAPPTWQTYLRMNYVKPEPPNAVFLPKTSDERAIWKKYVAIGWQNGIDQANAIYAENLARLKRDYTGMARYRHLLAQGMVSRPYVAKTNLGVTGDSSNLRINDEILRITALPQLQTNPRRWKPIITDGN